MYSCAYVSLQERVTATVLALQRALGRRHCEKNHHFSIGCHTFHVIVIHIVYHMPDLGAALSTTYVGDTSLSRQRINKAMDVLRRIARLLSLMHRNVQLVLSCAHAQAFHGCEASAVD